MNFHVSFAVFQSYSRFLCLNARSLRRYVGAQCETVPRGCRYTAMLRACRTVSPEALDPGSKVASRASESLKAFLEIVPEDLKAQAQKVRIERAERAKR